ncbi:hypothetical protein M9194_12965 [Vibrio sp. S4M6]|uniref:hypothetical protein n=1 Tax=Vibrio sinus TaxID=2946865 RepID=UPI002029D17B|nr:hypothetical protein [Vibrio sinus]MCL9782338.1 hypothetical protein [Vibrio sinus]
MVEIGNYQMAIDLLCCHLGLTEDEAKQQLGISTEKQAEKTITDKERHAVVGMSEEK